MGCWVETCFITRTPIFSGDPVVMIVVALDHDPDCLITGTWPGRAIERVEIGPYNDYGWVEGVEGATSDGMAHRMAGKKEAYERALFAHQAAWSKVVATDLAEAEGPLSHVVERERTTERLLREHGLAKEAARPDDSDDFWERMGQLLKVLQFCYLCRVNPAGGLVLKGSQTVDLELFEKLRVIESEAVEAWRTKKQVDDN
jgi:hypothetical protein